MYPPTDIYPLKFRLKRLGVLAFLLLGATLGAPTVLAPAPALAQVSAQVREGYTLLAEGRIPAAIALFERLAEQNPEDLETQLGLGIAYRRGGRAAEAVATYQRALEIDPDNQLALSSLGYFGEFRPEWQPIGIAALNRLLDLEPNSLEARAQRGKLLFYQGLFPQSIADYAQVTGRTADPDILGPAAEAYTYSGDYITGLQLFERYREQGGSIDDDRTIAYAQALRQSGQLNTAIQVLQRELGSTREFDAQQIRLRGALASAYAAARQFETAYSLVQPLQGRNDARLTLARAFNAMGQYSQQRGFTQQAAALYQNVLAEGTRVTPGTQREASFVLSALPEQRPLALQLVSQLRQAVPEDESLAFQQQVLAFQTGQISRRSFIEQVRTNFPNLPTNPVEVRYISQSLSQLSPAMPELMPLYLTLANGETTDPFLNFRVAQIYVEQGQFGQAQAALAAYNQTPAGRQDEETIQLFLAELESESGNIPASIQRYEGLLATTRSPQVRAGATQGLISLLQSRGQGRNAIALYDRLIAQNPQDFGYQMGRAAVAYQTAQISEEQAATVLSQGQQLYGQSAPPPELITLATVLPPRSSRLNLYRQLLNFEPNNTGLQLRFLQVLAASNPDQARALLAQLEQQNSGNFDFYFVQGEIAQQLEDFELARRSYETVLQQQPGNLQARLSLAGLAFRQGNYAQADALYRDILANNGQNPSVRTALASLSASQGRSLSAIEQLEAWQQTQGVGNVQVAEQIQRLREGLLQQRGIQPAWERF